MHGPVSIDLLRSAGYASPGGVGAPVEIGPNRSVQLTLDVTEAIDAHVGWTVDVSIETASSQRADVWRTVARFAQVSAVGSQDLDVSGADAFIRARYKLSNGATVALSLAGTAALELLASTAISAAGHGSAVYVGQYRAARLTLDVTAISGAGATLTAIVETASSSTASTWTTAGTFDAAAAVGQYDLTVAGLERYVRVRWTVAGTAPSVTATVAGEGVFCLASPADRARLGIRGGTIPDVSNAGIVDALIAATPIVLGYLNTYDLPLVAWGDDLRKACIAVADFDLVTNRGVEPDKQLGASMYVARYREYVGEPPQRNGWLDLVRRKELRPVGIVDSTPPTSGGEIQRVTVASDTLRGWGRRTVGLP